MRLILVDDHPVLRDAIRGLLAFISVKTVETHRSRINKKLGVHSTAQLIRFAALSGLVSS